MSRAIAETMPRVTVPPRPKGLPTAMTSSPTRTWSLSPSSSTGRFFVVDLEQREVGLLVGADDLGVELAVVGEADLHGLGVVDHVVVGDDVAVALDHEARAERHALLDGLGAALRAFAASASRPRAGRSGGRTPRRASRGRRAIPRDRPAPSGPRPLPGWRAPSPPPGWSARPGRRRRSAPRPPRREPCRRRPGRRPGAPRPSRRRRWRPAPWC